MGRTPAQQSTHNNIQLKVAYYHKIILQDDWLGNLEMQLCCHLKVTLTQGAFRRPTRLLTGVDTVFKEAQTTGTLGPKLVGSLRAHAIQDRN